MPSLNKSGPLDRFAWWFPLIFAAVISLWVFVQRPLSTQVRELAMAQAALAAVQPSGTPGHRLSPGAAQRLCETVGAQALQRLDCRTGLSLDAPAGATASADARLLLSARAGLDGWIEGYRALRDQLSARLATGGSRTWVLAGIELRLGELERRRLGVSPGYAEVFDALLIAEGVRYSSVSGQFSVQRWDLARLLDSPRVVLGRAEQLEQILFLLPWLVGLLALVGCGFVQWSLGTVAGLVYSIFFGLATLGLLVVADASVRFGQGSPVYLLNPFAYALERQILVYLVGVAMPCLLLAAVIFQERLFTRTLTWISSHFIVMSFLMFGLATGLYSLVSPAAGSEAMKLAMAGFAGVVTSLYARQAYLTRLHLPKALTVAGLASGCLSLFLTSEKLKPRSIVAAQLLKAFGLMLFVGLLVIGVAALVFSDLGGSLVSAAVVFGLVFLLFGLRMVFVVSALGLVAIAVALLTDKVQGRIDLMLSPMTAAVSDFARLIKFSEAAPASGYGLGSLRWCSNEGSCLPIQVLSDYFPVLLTGVFGESLTVFLFVFLVLGYFLLMLRAGLGLAKGGVLIPLVYAVAFFLLFSSLVQTAITFLGNWRLMPLTGLGLPVLSMGWSSMISVALGLGALGIAERLTQGRPMPQSRALL
jgi:cell division protein FtsW (lipid II flippase)